MTPERDLHFFINGREAGIAATNVPDNPYGVVDIWGSHCVNLINVSEVRISTEMSQSPVIRRFVYPCPQVPLELYKRKANLCTPKYGGAWERGCSYMVSYLCIQ